jgi:hypothetical protein
MAGTRRSARAQNTESSESTAIPKTRDAIRSSKSTTVAKSPIAPKRVTKSSARLARSRRGGTPPVDEEVADNADNAEVNAQDSKTVGKSKSAGKLAKVIATKGRATRGRGKAAVQEAIDDTVVVTPFGNITGNAETPKRSTRLAKSATLAPVITINSEGSVLEMTEDNARAIGRALRETRRKATNKIGVTKSPISRPPSDRRPTRKGRQSGSSSSKDEYEPAQEEPVKKSRATRTAESIEIESHPTQTYSEEMPQKQEPAKKARTTHGKKAVDPDPQPQVEEVPQEKQEPVKKTRSSRGKKTTKSELPLDLMDVSQDKEEPAKVSRANRGRKAVVSEPQPEVTDASQEKVQEPAKKTRTTREKKLAELESQEQLELPVIHEEVPEQQKPVKARITRGKKNIDPEPQQQLEPKPIKKARSTRAKRSVEPEANLESIVSPDVVSVGQEPTNSRGTRGRKMAEAEAELPVQRQEPIRKTRNKRVNQPTESELEPNKLSLQTKGRQTRPTRGKKAVDTQKVVMEMVPPQIGRPVRKGRRTSAKTAELPAPQPSTPKTPGRKARQSVGPKSVAKNLRVSYSESELMYVNIDSSDREWNSTMVTLFM